MRMPALRYAVEQFQALRVDLDPVKQLIDGQSLKCLVRQKKTGEEQGWVCDQVGVDEESHVFWGEFVESSPDPESGRASRRVRVYVDSDSIESFEYEVFPTIQMPVEP